MGWDYTKRSIQIESKIYHLEFDKAYRGSRARIKESSRRGVFSFSIQFVSLLWLWECFKKLMDNKSNLKFFMQTRCDDYTLWVEKISNRRGNVAEVFKLDNNGHKCSIMVPEGAKQEGWILFQNLIEDYPGRRVDLLPTASYRQVDQEVSFADVVKSRKGGHEGTKAVKKALKADGNTAINEDQEVGETSRMNVKTRNQNPPSPVFPFEKIEWKKTIVLTRRFFHHDWVDIKSALQLDFSPYCSISPFHPNRALLFCHSEDLAIHLCSLQGWFSLKTFQVSFAFWNPQLHAKMDLVPSFGGWLKIRNLPIHLWNFETLRAVGDKCGGFIEVSSKTTLFRETMEAYVKVKGNYTGFVPAEVEVMDDLGFRFKAQITTHFSVPLLLKNVGRIHGSLSRSMEEEFLIENPMEELENEKWVSVNGKGKGKEKANDQPCFPSPVSKDTSKQKGEVPKEPFLNAGSTAILSTDEGMDEDSDVSGQRLSEDVSHLGEGLADTPRCLRTDKNEVLFDGGPASGPGSDSEAHFHLKDAANGAGPSRGVAFRADLDYGDGLICNETKGPKNSLDPTKIKLLKRQSVGSTAVINTPFSSQAVSHTNALTRRRDGDSEELDSEALLSSFPSDFVIDSQEDLIPDSLAQESPEAAGFGRREGLCSDLDCVVAKPLAMVNEDLEDQRAQYVEESWKRNREDQGDQDFYITSNGFICDSNGENKIKLGDWLNETNMKIISKSGKRAKKAGGLIRNTVGQRELKNLESSINYDRCYAKRKAGHQVVDVNCLLEC